MYWFRIATEPAAPLGGRAIEGAPLFRLPASGTLIASHTITGVKR